jgi:hypothetical protein
LRRVSRSRNGRLVRSMSRKEGRRIFFRAENVSVDGLPSQCDEGVYSVVQV